MTLIPTTKGKGYAITPTTNCTVYANNAAQTLIATCTAGEQKVIVSPTSGILITDANALVTETFSPAAPSASGSGGTLIVNHTDVPTPEGTDDCSYVYADIPAKYIPAGTLQSIVLKGASNDGNGYVNPAYLVVWQEQAPGTDDFRPVAVSTNAVTLQANAANEWKFASPALLNERIRFYLSDSPTLDSSFAWSSDKKLRSRVLPTTRWQDGHVFTPDTLYCLPELIIRMDGASEKYAPMLHAVDTGMHLSPEERVGLSALLARKDDILASLPSTQELTDEPEAVGGNTEGTPAAQSNLPETTDKTYEFEL